MRKARQSTLQLFMTVIMAGLCAVPIAAQTTAFTYQGKLTDAGNPANGQFDFQFKLFDTQNVGTGTQQGGDVNAANVTVANGSFSVQLDFGACASCFNGAARFVEIAVKPTSSGTFTALGPRQPITSTPYAIRSQNAATAIMADGLSVACVNCVTSSQIASVNGGAVTGTIPVASVPAGSPNYIQNTTTPQATSNFNISGDGTAGGILSGNLVNAATQFNLGGSRVLSAAGFNNLFAGVNAGMANTTGSSNAFFGFQAGQANNSGNGNSFFGFQAGFTNTTGSQNAFFGIVAGQANTTGYSNAFFGSEVGRANTTGFGNAFFGTLAGRANTTGSQNAFFGTNAGRANTTGFDNAFFGDVAGFYNTTGSQNAFFGGWTGYSNTTGESNTFIGFQAGQRNTTGNFNTIIGTLADFNSTSPAGNYNTLLGYGASVLSGVSNGTAIGANAFATQNNTVILGSIAGINGATDSVNVGIGTWAPLTRLDVRGDLVLDPGGSPTLFTSAASTEQNRYLHLINSPSVASASGLKAGGILVADDYGYAFPTKNDLIVKGYVGIGLGANVAPANPLHVAGDIRIGSGTSGCVLDNDGTVIAGTCSSDARLKRDILPFAHLLGKVAQLQPVQFYWRAEEFKERHFGTKPSFGLIAQEVEKVLPELVTEDEQGYKAVNYSKLPLLTLQAIKELKAENDALKQRLNEQQASGALQQQSRQLKKQQTQIARQQREIGELRQAIKALTSSIHNHYRK